ncbi:MAG: glycosyl hydrolase [Petrimonas sp.]|nr:glycosyl hydrolase [Petrimonas sp.]
MSNSAIFKSVLLKIIIIALSLLIDSCIIDRNIYRTKFNTSYSELLQDFKSPPNNAKIRAYWWWLNSNVNKDCITKDLEAMKNNGYGGAMIFDAGSSAYDVAHKTEAGPAFLSKEWLKLFGHAVKEAERLGLELSINVQSGWNPGGPSVTPELALKKISWSELTISGPATVDVELPAPSEENK